MQFGSIKYLKLQHENLIFQQKDCKAMEYFREPAVRCRVIRERDIIIDMHHVLNFTDF